MATVARIDLLSDLIRRTALPAGRTVAQAKAEEDAAWRHRQDERRRDAFYQATGRYPGGFVG